MNTDSVSLLKHLPFCLLCICLPFDKDGHCTRGTFFGFSFPSQGFSAAYWRGATWQISFTLCPQQSWLYCSNEVVLFASPCQEKKDEKEKTSWLHVTLNQQDTCQCLLRFLLLLSRFNFNVLACTTFPFGYASQFTHWWLQIAVSENWKIETYIPRNIARKMSVNCR